MRVEAVTRVTSDLVADVARLVPQVSSSAPAPSEGELREIVATPGSTLFVARDDEGGVVGMLTLVTYRIPTGLNAVIEDVVVEETARGAGAGTALVEAAIEEARRRGARHVDLTSRPSREAANRLYQKLGFALRETNVYRHTGA
ncbi:MAG TPA: GNAT family N-acetyltransferase [Acidimicrobiales bacterium]|nr:GNAT family N-acetyltransferase [Acidimicrobiales bacterium]